MIKLKTLLKEVFDDDIPLKNSVKQNYKTLLKENSIDVKDISRYNKIMINEHILNEGNKLLTVESFLRDAIKGTEWENNVYAVGGYTRDLIMGNTPKDMDLVVETPNGGILFANWLAKKYGIYKENSNPVIASKFGTAKLRLDGVVYKGVDLTGEDIETVMTRSEQYNDPNSRKPDVEFSDIKGDAERRDLSINAIYKKISTGEIIDPVGGVNDIKNKIIRTPISPDEIYKDDALRMFRVIRFSNRFGWNLTPEVIDGIKRNLNNLGNTSKERIRDELNKILLSDTPDRGIQMLKDVGLLPYIAPELQAAVGLGQNSHHSEDVFDHTMSVLSKTKPILFQRILALCHDIGKVATHSITPTGVHFYGHELEGEKVAIKIMRDLKYPTEMIDAVAKGVKNHMRLKRGGDDAVQLTDKALRKFKIEMGDHLEDILSVIHADNVSHSTTSTMPNQIENVRKRLAALDIQVTKPKLPINGNDLIELGVPKGPIFTSILSAITDAWYENPNLSRKEALEIAKQVVENK